MKNHQVHWWIFIYLSGLADMTKICYNFCMKFTLTKAKNLPHAIQSVFSQVKNLTGKICLLVPDKLTVTLEKKLFEYLNIEASFDIEVSTLTRFSNKILTELNVSYSPISKLGSVILLKKILSENRDNLKMFNNHSYSYNYADDIFKTLTQFKASQITANDMQTDDIKSPTLKNKIEDLSKILEEYEYQKAGLIDQTDRLNLFALNIAKSNSIKQTNFFFLGFDNFTSQGYLVIEHLIKNAKSVNVAIYQNNLNYNFHSEVAEHLQELAFKLNLPLSFYEENYLSDKLHLFLSEHLFSNDKQSMQIKNQISLKNATSINEEIEFTVRNIREKLLEGEQYNKFGIACYELEKYASQIRNTMDKYELNYYIDVSTPLCKTFYFKFVVNYIKIFLNNFDINNIIQLINSEFIVYPDLVKLKLNKVLKEIGYLPKNNKFLDTEEAELLNFILTLFEQFPISKNINLKNFKNLLNQIFDFFDSYNITESISSQLTDSYAKKILLQEKDSLLSLLDEIETFYPDVNMEDLLDIMLQASKEVKINPIPQSIDCVQIIDASEIFTDFDNLYILNCNRSTCPTLMQDVGIILDSDISSLPFNKKLEPTIAYLNRLAKLKMFNNVQMFNKNLTVTMSNYNESEKSDLIIELQNRFFISENSGNEIEITNLEIQSLNAEKQHNILSKWDLIEFLSENAYSLSNDILSFYGIAPNQPVTFLKEESKQTLTFDEISCSSLENYFKCPMNFFLSNILKLEVERSAGIAMVDVGNMMHLLAEDFYSLADRTKIDVKLFSEKKLLQYMSNDKKLSSFIDTPIHHNLIGEAIRFLNHLKYMDENSKFVPTFFEYTFDSKFNKSIQLCDNIFLRGKIDRIDFYEDYLRIIDYKTGEVNASLKELYYGKKLQLFLYAKLASEIFNKKIAGSFYFPVKNSILNEKESSRYKLSGFYINEQELASAFDKRIMQTGKSDLLNLSLNKDGEIKQDSRSSKVLNRKDFNELMDYSLKLSSQAIQEIKQGYISANPIKFDEQSTSCVYCPYMAICRKNSMNINYRTVCDVSLESFGGNNG